jgi:hypothetical protein
MAQHFLEHHSGTYYLFAAGTGWQHGHQFNTQRAGIDYARAHYGPPQHTLHVERVEYLQTGNPPQWRKEY